MEQEKYFLTDSFKKLGSPSASKNGHSRLLSLAPKLTAELKLRVNSKLTGSGLGLTPVQSRRVFLLGLKRSGFPRKIHKHRGLCVRAQEDTPNMLRSSTFSHSLNILYACMFSFSIDLAKSSHVRILKCQITRMFPS